MAVRSSQQGPGASGSLTALRISQEAVSGQSRPHLALQPTCPGDSGLPGAVGSTDRPEA